MVAAGKRKHRIRIQSPASGQDSSGQPNTGWTDVATVWAQVRDISGREFVAGGGLQNSVRTGINIRYRADVAAEMRVLHGAVSYNIEAVLKQDDGSLMLMCSALR